MKTMLRGLFLALPLLALPSQVHAHGSVTISSGFSLRLWGNCSKDCLGGCGPCGGGGCLDWNSNGLGPWYSYWPYDNHFITPAHPEYPYWPQAMTPVIPGGQLNAPPALPHAPAAYYPNYPNTGVYQPVSYPSYWYGR